MTTDVYVFSFYGLDNNKDSNNLHRNKKADKKCKECRDCNSSLQADEKNPTVGKTTESNEDIECYKNHIERLNKVINNQNKMIAEYKDEIDKLNTRLNNAKDYFNNFIKDVDGALQYIVGKLNN